ncbi:hypothetical protein RIF29_15158 [Crotalaria pallida]|uniref:Aminotransferase class I/classII large domain-containing protein n=1 Tax=Crotalaria pallida TaxID=3830 RepID=A0AAN9FF46_CROPI
MYSNPPIHGASILAAILRDRDLYNERTVELKAMADRIINMRQKLFDDLRARGTPGDWSHIIKQIGMFTFTGLNAEQGPITEAWFCFDLNRFQIEWSFLISVKLRVKSQVKLVVRPMYSNPPIHGASILAAILRDRDLYNERTVELKAMADRIINMRQKLFDDLRARGTPGDWSHIIKQIGMFTFTGLNAEQVSFMAKEYHIYMTSITSYLFTLKYNTYFFVSVYINKYFGLWVKIA